jgi:hypothetical protein
MTATRLTEPYQPARLTEPHQHHLRLAREPAAAAEARSQVRAVIRAWKVPVDPDIAVLLTSDMVTDAIMRGDGETVTLTISCSRGHLRIDVHDTSRSRPAAEEGGPAVTETGRGLVLVAALSAEWGSFRTLAGKARYFTLAFQPDRSLAASGWPHWPRAGAVRRGPRPARRPHWLHIQERHQPAKG